MYDYQLPNRPAGPRKGQLLKVSGEGEVAAKPDTASINLGVITEAKELILSQQQNSAVTAKVIQALLSLGIPQALLQTFDYRIESEYDFEQGKQIFRGYKITHILQAKVEDLSMVGKVIDTAVQNGVNNVSNVQFAVKNKQAYYEQALSLAITNATEKAKAIATTLNVTLIPTPILVVEGGPSFPPLYNQPKKYVAGVSSTHFEPGQLLIKAAIFAEFHYY